MAQEAENVMDLPDDCVQEVGRYGYRMLPPVEAPWADSDGADINAAFGGTRVFTVRAEPIDGDGRVATTCLRMSSKLRDDADFDLAGYLEREAAKQFTVMFRRDLPDPVRTNV